jgi:hypothetical protein
MAGLVPAIHAFLVANAAKAWMPGIKPGMTKNCKIKRAAEAALFEFCF